MQEIIQDTRRKALQINLDAKIYGTFAEIGAGQEVARHFFLAGAASGTIAKTMSAYDMTFSDQIYGAEETGRYVSKSRLLKMLDHEYTLLTERLCGEKYNERAFFAFADTVTTLNYNKTNDPHGWVGIKYQLDPRKEPNEILFHVRLLDSDAVLQQNVLGILGVNLVYAAYHYSNDVRRLIESLADNLSVGSVEIDLISVDGVIFKDIDNVLINLYLVQKGYSSAAIFESNGEAAQAKDLLYKKHLMIWRNRFKQKSKPNYEMFTHATRQFKKTYSLDDKDMIILAEITMNHMLAEGDGISDQLLISVVEKAREFMSRGYKVLITDFTGNDKLVNYLTQCKPSSIGVTTNVANIENIFNSENHGENYTNNLLTYVGAVFAKNVKMFVYPYKDAETGEIMTAMRLGVSPHVRHLYKFLLENEYITDIQDYVHSDVRPL